MKRKGNDGVMRVGQRKKKINKTKKLTESSSIVEEIKQRINEKIQNTVKLFKNQWMKNWKKSEKIRKKKEWKKIKKER